MSTKENKLSLVLVVILGAISAISPLAIDMYLPSIPLIANEMGATIGTIQTTLTIYTASFAVGQLIYGPLSDSYGRRSVLLGGIIGYTVFSGLIIFSRNVEMLFWFRALQGFTGAAAAVVVQALVRDLFEKEEFARTMSFIMLVMTLAPLCAPIMGGYIAKWYSWRMIFTFMALFGLILTVSIWFNIPETLNKYRRARFHPRSILKNYWKIAKNPPALAYIFMNGFSFTGMFCFITVGSSVYIGHFNVKPELFGYFFGLNVIALIVMTIIQGQYVRRLGTDRLLRIGLTIQLMASIIMIMGLWFSSSIWNFGLWGMVLPIMIYIGTVSLIGSNSMACLLDHYPELAGTASSLAGFVRFETGALIASLLALLSDTLAIHHIIIPNSPWPLALAMLICACGCFGCYLLVHRYNVNKTI